MQKSGFIGAGKVACTMGRYFSEKGISVVGYYDKSAESADTAATFTQTTAFSDMEELVGKSDIIFIATPDDVISSVWRALNELDIRGKVVGIFSGSLSSDLFSGIEVVGASGASIHPMYAFSDKFSDYQKLHTARFTIEGGECAVSALSEIMDACGNSYTVIDPACKKRYHAAASVASNLMVGLYDMSLSMLADCGFSREDAAELIGPLVEKNISALVTSSPEEALTGPIERGDVQTVRAHLQAMTDEEKEVYMPLARRLISVAERKNPDRSYEEMKDVLTES